MNKHYGLTGETVKVKLKNGDSDRYPWQGMTVPVLITGEQKLVSGTIKIILCLILSLFRGIYEYVYLSL